MEKPLEGIKVAVLAADGFEQVELTRPVRVLERRGAQVRIISLRPGVLDADPAQYSALLLPGGLVDPDLLRQSRRALDFVRAIDKLGRPIAVICHGPWLLVSADLVRDRRLTSWPGIADDVRNAGGRWEDSEVVRDRNWVSSRGPHDLTAFERAMVFLFAEKATRELAAPARSIRWVGQTMRAGMMVGGLVAAEMARRAIAARRQQAFRW